jgi:hypothetical protein
MSLFATEFDFLASGSSRVPLPPGHRAAIGFPIEPRPGPRPG